MGSNWHLVAGILNQDVARNINTPVNNLTSNTGNYISSFANGFAPRFVITSDTAYLNGSFGTCGSNHDLTFRHRRLPGLLVLRDHAGDRRQRAARYRQHRRTDDLSRNPPPVRRMCWPTSTPPTPISRAFNLGDTMPFQPTTGRRALAVSQDWFHVKNFNAKGSQAPEYSNHGVSPTASIMFKPAPT